MRDDANRYKVIVNPTAGRGAARRAIPAVEEALSKYGIGYDLVCTEFPFHAADIAESAILEGFDTLIAVGGDGTTNEIINGIIRARQAGVGTAALGIIPIGGGNDFAFGMGLPLDFRKSIKILAERETRWVDIGLLCGGQYPEGRYFGNGVGIGFDAVVSFVASQKRLRGFAGYLIAAIQTIYRYFEAPTVKIDLGGESFVQPSLMVSIMNGRRMAGGFMMAPQAAPNDGLFDVVIADEVPPSVIWQLIPRFLQGSQFGHPAIKFCRTERVTVRAIAGQLPVHADGEEISEGCEQVIIEIVPHAIELICPCTDGELH